jgi:carbon storage regulator
MLVLTRKCSEVIRIGDEIVVKVIQTGRNTVKIGIEAPAHVRVLRGELSEKLEAAGETLVAAGHVAEKNPLEDEEMDEAELRRQRRLARMGPVVTGT